MGQKPGSPRLIMKGKMIWTHLQYWTVCRDSLGQLKTQTPAKNEERKQTDKKYFETRSK